MKWLAPLIIVIILIIFGAWFCGKHPELPPDAKNYQIRVIAFDKNTGNGSAYIKLDDPKKEGDPDPTVRISVEGYNGNKNPDKAKIYLDSENADAYITVNGKLTRESGRPAVLTILEKPASPGNVNSAANSNAGNTAGNAAGNANAPANTHANTNAPD